MPKSCYKFPVTIRPLSAGSLLNLASLLSVWVDITDTLRVEPVSCLRMSTCEPKLLRERSEVRYYQPESKADIHANLGAFWGVGSGG